MDGPFAPQIWAFCPIWAICPMPPGHLTCMFGTLAPPTPYMILDLPRLAFRPTS